MFKLLLTWRYFIRRRVAWFAVAAVTAIVTMVLVVLSVMSGLLEETRGYNFRWTGQVVISRDSMVGFPYYQGFIETITRDGPAVRATPVIKTFGLVEDFPNRQNARQLYGLRLDEFCAVTGFAQSLHYQKNIQRRHFTLPEQCYLHDQCIITTPEQRRRGCILGIYTLQVRDKAEVAAARQRLLRPDRHLPVKVTVLALNSGGRLTGSETGETQTFWYVDDSDSGLVDIDMNALYMDFDELQRLCYMDGSDGSPPRASEIRIKLTEGIEPQSGRQQIAALWQQYIKEKEGQTSTGLLQDVKVQTWEQFRRVNIAPVEKERNMMIMVFLLLSLVSVFIIFAIFYMIVTEKIRDLGVIKSVGGSGHRVAEVFLAYGLLIGIIGALLGSAFGVVIVKNSNEIAALLKIQIWNPAVYAIDRIPDVVDYTQMMFIALAAMLSSVAGAALPARRAAKLQVVEALRVE